MLDEVLHSVSEILNSLPEQREIECDIADAAEELALQFNDNFDFMIANSPNVELSYHYIQTIIRCTYRCCLEKLKIKPYEIQESQTWDQFR